MENRIKSPRKPQWNILELLNWTTSYFKSRQVESPRTSAEILLAYALNTSRLDLYLRYDQPMKEEELARFKKLLLRRARYEPVAYITGKKEFWSLDFEVSSHVLIPRPETECLVEAVLDRLPERCSPGDSRRILDVGTGSGAVVVSLCKERPDHFYFASDISHAALELARANARRHGLGSFIRFFCGRFFDPLKKTGCLFDAIVSNPPYIKSDDMAGLQPEVRLFEPEGALNGGAEGLDAVYFLIQNAPGFLADTGCLFLEIGYDQKTAVQDMATHTGAWRDIEFIKDLSGVDRVVKLVR